MWEREGKVRGKGGREEEGDCLLLCGVAPGEGNGGTEGRRVGRLVGWGGAACCCAATPQERGMEGRREGGWVGWWWWWGGLPAAVRRRPR